ncbi:hypothetical protein BCIN_03g01050 [Botrytis cinerea B05.10]|uniref:Zn(2)-C6 fungal-type domain-containing protein n=1 Tax=Botryotinia fuckeliana (strain B05.10) TaxID=332648 RepID=A0A384JBK4_BOTFB|nr:hypothetical protein BCIN_03g01050 [Botrytis cinerea B05.10]ATZ47807.1 hypothetical protein BCIN_03g01050 [Botrytis cinerea B05.10]
MSAGAGAGAGGVPQKQIRFVNNEGQPPAKRRRVNAACRTCRKRKTRCDGKRPLCSTCTDNGHECMGYAEGSDGATNLIRKEVKTPDGGEGDEGDYAHSHPRRPGILRETSRDAVPQQSQQRANTTAARTRVEVDQSYMHDASRKLGSEDIGNNRPGTRRVDYRDAVLFPDESPNPLERDQPLLSETTISESHRVPYFRYFGPTAIVPGFKQMVVSVREHKRSMGAPSSSSLTMSPISAKHSSGGSVNGTPSQAGTEPRSAIDMPLYDPNDPLPVNRLIIHLVEVFFAHLGCNYPFLSKRQENFKRLVEEKKVEPILVDAVCALAARFSDHPLLTTSHDSPQPKSEYGQVFAQRAKAAVVDTFPCPTVGAVQACLLLAYEGFGANQDSALWMYLGCAIRMAVDLGLQKLDGVKHQGQKDPGYHRSANEGESDEPDATITAEEKSAIEEERIDTLWAVLMLDRVISSGTGRPVSLKDEDLELTLPSVSNNTEEAWPDPFPALIRIIHLYGLVSDLLNRIRGAGDITPGLIKQLKGMEKDLTVLYQSLDGRLEFSATNFQHYVKSGEGTNFILVHFWFHTLIMLLHQPTLMQSLEGQVLQLLPHSRELSMSSAKTIADILAFAELIDPRSFIGNPFTCQPIYIAGCAFLKEIALHTSQPSSRNHSPRQSPPSDTVKPGGNHNQGNQKQKHSLLAAAANQNYQRCHKALQHIESYWAGTRYIRVAMEQKQSGIDPQEVETYTAEEYTEATKPRHEIIPNWRRKFSANSPGRFPEFVRSPMLEALPGSPAIDLAQAIGWSLTGTTNSPSSNLTFMYQNQSAADHLEMRAQKEYGQGNMIYDPIRQSLPENTAGGTSTSGRFDRFIGASRSNHMPPPGPKFMHGTNSNIDASATADAEMLLGLGGGGNGSGSPYPTPRSENHAFDPGPRNTISPRPGSSSTPSGGGGYDFSHTPSTSRAGGFYNHNNHNHNNNNASNLHGNNTNSVNGHGNGTGNGQGNAYHSGNHTNTNSHGYMGMGMGSHGMGDMMMSSQDIDMRGLGEDMMPWLEYLPGDMLGLSGFFGEDGDAGGDAGGG